MFYSNNMYTVSFTIYSYILGFLQWNH